MDIVNRFESLASESDIFNKCLELGMNRKDAYKRLNKMRKKQSLGWEMLKIERQNDKVILDLSSKLDEVKGTFKVLRKLRKRMKRL